MKKTNNQEVGDKTTQLQADLEGVLKGILEQAGNKIKPERREVVKNEIENTRQLLERLKSKYV